MTQKTRNELKDLFKTGAKPSGDDFKAFIDSTLNVSDDGIAKAAGADTPLKINAQGTDEKLLDFYTGETKTWSINQKPADDKTGLNIATPGGSKLFIDSNNGNVGIGTTSPGAKLEVNGDLKLKLGATVNEFSTDGNLSGNSDLVIPTEKAVKTYADTKARLAGSSSQDFAANSLTLSNSLKLKLGATVNEFSTDGTLAGNSDLVIPTEKAVKTYADKLLARSSSQKLIGNNLSVNRITSPMWKVTELLNRRPGPTPIEVEYTSSGGTLVIWFSGSFDLSTGRNVMMYLFIEVDGTRKGESQNYLWDKSGYTPFTMPPQVITGVRAGSRRIEFKAWDSTSYDGFTNKNCWFYATVMELPF